MNLNQLTFWKIIFLGQLNYHFIVILGIFMVYSSCLRPFLLKHKSFLIITEFYYSINGNFSLKSWFWHKCYISRFICSFCIWIARQYLENMPKRAIKLRILLTLKWLRKVNARTTNERVRKYPETKFLVLSFTGTYPAGLKLENWRKMRLWENWNPKDQSFSIQNI
jgi:hypothetical protein